MLQFLRSSAPTSTGPKDPASMILPDQQTPFVRTKLPACTRVCTLYSKRQEPLEFSRCRETPVLPISNQLSRSKRSVELNPSFAGNRISHHDKHPLRPDRSSIQPGHILRRPTTWGIRSDSQGGKVPTRHSRAPRHGAIATVNRYRSAEMFGWLLWTYLGKPVVVFDWSTKFVGSMLSEFQPIVPDIMKIMYRSWRTGRIPSSRFAECSSRSIKRHCSKIKRGVSQTCCGGGRWLVGVGTGAEELEGQPQYEDEDQAGAED